MLPERPFSYRAQDDEDHRLVMCGYSFDERQLEQLEDFYSRHYDFIFTPGAGLSLGPGVNGDGSVCRTFAPVATFLAPGSARARFPLGAKRGQVCEEDPATPGLARLAPPIFQT